MSSRFETARQAETYEAQLAAAIERLKNWLPRYSEIKDGKSYMVPFAGTAMVNAFREDMGDVAFINADDADFQYALETMVTTFPRRRVKTEVQVRADLVEDIISALQSTNDSAWQDRHTVDTEIKKMAFWSLESLNKRLAEILEKQRLSKLPGYEVREDLQATRAAQQPAPAPTRKVLPADITRTAIHSMNSDSIKALIRTWGADSVNDRLFSRS